MDGSRFDTLTKGLARAWDERGEPDGCDERREHGAMTRRRALRGLTGALLGVVGMAAKPVSRGDAAAICYASGEYCNADSECCQGTCTLGICRCPSGLVNCNGLCRDNCSGCPAGWRLCNGACRDISTDPRNCGRCGATCAKGSHCENGKCCRQGEVNCGGVCVPRIQCV